MLEGTIWGKQTGQHTIFSHCFVSLTDKIDFECVYGSHRICSLFSTWRFDVLSGRKSHAINFTLWIAIGVKLSLYHWIIPEGEICISIFEPDDCEFYMDGEYNLEYLKKHQGKLTWEGHCRVKRVRRLLIDMKQDYKMVLISF